MGIQMQQQKIFDDFYRELVIVANMGSERHQKKITGINISRAEVKVGSKCLCMLFQCLFVFNKYRTTSVHIIVYIVIISFFLTRNAEHQYQKMNQDVVEFYYKFLIECAVLFVRKCCKVFDIKFIQKSIKLSKVLKKYIKIYHFLK